MIHLVSAEKDRFGQEAVFFIAFFALFHGRFLFTWRIFSDIINQLLKKNGKRRNETMAVIEYDEYKQKLLALEPMLGELEAKGNIHLVV